MERWLICGSPRWNNYYLVHHYAKMYLPKSAIIVTCGGTTGTDQLAIEYAHRNNHAVDEYPIAVKNLENVKQRNRQIERYCHGAIIFNDNTQGTLSDLLDVFMSTKKAVVTVDISPDDQIDFNWRCTDPQLNHYFDACSQREITYGNIADLTLAILYHPDLMEQLYQAKEEVYVKSDTPSLAGGLSRWMKLWAVHDLLLRLKDQELNQKGTEPNPEELAKYWTQVKHPTPVFTSEATQLLKDFNEVVASGNRIWLEANKNQVVDKNVFLGRQDEDDSVNTFYQIKDNSDVVIFERNTEFEDAPFQVGKWYVDGAKVHTKLNSI